MNFDDTDLQDTVDFVANKAPMASYFAVNAMFKPLTDGESNVIENVVVDAERLAQVVCAAAFDQARERQARLEYVPVPAAKPDGIPMLSEISLEQSKKAAEKYLQWLNTIAEENK